MVRVASTELSDAVTVATSPSVFVRVRLMVTVTSPSAGADGVGSENTISPKKKENGKGGK
jgi:hypothetical protein